MGEQFNNALQLKNLQHFIVDEMEGKHHSNGSYAVTTISSREEDGLCLHIIHWYIRTREESLCREPFIVAFLVAETLLGAAASDMVVFVYDPAATRLT